MRIFFLFAVLFCMNIGLLKAQNSPQGDCPYPVLLIHGWTGNYASWEELSNNQDFTDIWGTVADTIWTVNNAYTHTAIYGPDGIPFNEDDDVLTKFTNETNTLNAGCVYLMDMMNFWDETPLNPMIEKGNSWGFFSGESDSNESAIRKSGPAIRMAIKQILAANPNKSKVILAGYSMGGLAAREYLQRIENGQRAWWAFPNEADGHRIAKLLTVGTPHRGSNTLGNFSATGVVDDRNGNPDIYSEAVRDLRYSRSCGFLNLFDCPGIYLFGGDENDLGSWYRNNDVDCDGDETSSEVQGLNISGKAQFGTNYDEWDGTKEHPAHPLPDNLKYTYYVSNLFNIGCNSNFPGYGCGGDGVVDDERQWIYTGGDGKTDTYLEGTSIPSPSDGVPYRLTDRISSTNRVSHTGQQGDFDFIIRGFDEGDYPYFASGVQLGRWYAGLAQIRPEKIPMDSERTLGGNRFVDGDWYKVNLTADRAIKLHFRPNMDMDMRVDIYTETPDAYGNADGDVWSMTYKGTLAQSFLQTPVLLQGTYYFRFSNWLNTATDPVDAWKTAYTFKAEQVLPISIGTNLDELQIAPIYPQPAQDYITIPTDWSGTDTPFIIRIYTARGILKREVKTHLLNGAHKHIVPMVGLAPGPYFVHLIWGQQSKAFMVEKQ